MLDYEDQEGRHFHPDTHEATLQVAIRFGPLRTNLAQVLQTGQELSVPVWSPSTIDRMDNKPFRCYARGCCREFPYIEVVVLVEPLHHQSLRRIGSYLCRGVGFDFN
jgi:hypothetical protein